MKALTLSLGIFALARAAPAPSPDPLSGATIVDQQVTVQVFPDQPPVTLNGTLQEVEAQLRQLNPDWDSTTASGSNQARAAVPDDVNAAAGLEKRADEDWSKAKVICSQGNWGYVNNLAYNEIVNIYENSWRSNTAAVLRPGPKKCGRLYCAYRTAFYACNDNAEKYSVHDFTVMSHAIREMWKRCGNNELHDMKGAQIFSPNKWNIIMEQNLDC
ncbi:hypothetical protein VFPBJ_04070 [Purpureocillium lilacinum]|uniref:Uncharacterized protein n=1 Tax=Purpureocillium lilacinum TaxID=33203 RepID=A0A179GU51_PURLI|nr:hypothetical protein VFPBJ_04070 [Purpureocillium lilacinum]